MVVLMSKVLLWSYKFGRLRSGQRLVSSLSLQTCETKVLLIPFWTAARKEPFYRQCASRKYISIVYRQRVVTNRLPLRWPSPFIHYLEEHAPHKNEIVQSPVAQVVRLRDSHREVGGSNPIKRKNFGRKFLTLNIHLLIDGRSFCSIIIYKPAITFIL